jgi:radical SAM superfamily enzyme YgiQ (UPF0313 family)
MKVFLGNSPWSKPGYYGVRAGSRWPHFEKEGACYMPFPFFMAYAAALLEDKGFDVTLVDGVAEGLSSEEFFARLEAASPNIVVYEVSTPSIEQDLKVANETKKRLGPDVEIVFCGPHHEMYRKEFLAEHRNIDIVACGEYEFTLLELSQVRASGGTPECVKGVIYRDASGVIHVNPDRPLEQDLKKFPWPARHLLPMDRYLDLPGGIPAPSLQIWASRGCPFSCIFCSWPQIMYGGSNYRTRDSKDVVDEIEYCIRIFGFKSFYFDDDTFNIGKERMLSLCEEIIRRSICLPWAIMARADCMDREILSAMKRAGLVALKYGVESAEPGILAASGKSLDLEKVRETVALTRELGIRYHLTFTFGLPGETWESIRKTIRFAKSMDPDSLQFSIVTPFPGSRYFNLLDGKGYLLSKNWEEYDGYNRAVIRTEHLSAGDLERALTKANRSWKRHVFLRDLCRDPISTLRYVTSNPLRCWSIYFNR